jgi:hypothetical protein
LGVPGADHGDRVAVHDPQRPRRERSRAAGADTGRTPGLDEPQGQRLKRVFNIDVETRPACGGAVRIIACIEDPGGTTTTSSTAATRWRTTGGAERLLGTGRPVIIAHPNALGTDLTECSPEIGHCRPDVEKAGALRACPYPVVLVFGHLRS